MNGAAGNRWFLPLSEEEEWAVAPRYLSLWENLLERLRVE